MGSPPPIGNPSGLECVALGMRYLLLSLLLTALGPLSLLGEKTSGTLIERISCPSDSRFSYALFLPEGHNPDQPTPVLVVLDPRGRALRSLERFREGANELGWVVASSWDTQSDSAGAPNPEAFAALMNDLQSRVHIHPRRLYLTGFSGLSVTLFAFAPHMPTTLAGIIPVSGGPRNYGIEKDANYDIYGFAGTRDFNYQEMRELEQELDERKHPHRIVFFDGRHQWPSAEDAAEALRWLELRAMARKLRPQDKAWIESRWLQAKAHAEAVDEPGEEVEALLAYEILANDFVEFKDVSAATLRWDELARSKTVKRWKKAERRRATSEEYFREDLFQHFALMVQQRPAPTLQESIRALKVATLLQESENEDPWKAAAAQRKLAHIITHAGFYQPRAFLELGQGSSALAMTRLALAVWDQNGGARWFEARALAQMGRHEEAVNTLGRVMQLEGRFGVPAAKAEADFAPLLKRDDFRTLVKSLAPDTDTAPSP